MNKQENEEIKQILNEIYQAASQQNPARANIFQQMNKLAAILGKTSSNALKAQAAGGGEKYSTYFNGIRNQVLKLAVAAVMLYHYLITHFSADGKPIDRASPGGKS